MHLQSYGRRVMALCALLLAFGIPATGQMRLADVQPGMDHSKVLRELSKGYTSEAGYKIDDRAEGTFIIRWVEKDGKPIPPTGATIGSVFYTGSRVDLVEENYDGGSIADTTGLVQALVNELRGYLRQDVPLKGQGSRHAANARIVLIEVPNPAHGGSDSDIHVMFGNQGIALTLTKWKLGDRGDSYVTLVRRRVAGSD